MASTKLLVLALIVFIIVDELVQCQRNRDRTRGTSRRRNNRNRNRAGGANARRNRTRGGGGGRAGGRTRFPGCQVLQVPMCKGMVGYTHTKLPNRFNHTTQLQVYRVLEHMWAMMDRGCSDNFRLLACSLYLPRCNRRGRVQEPCARTCNKAKKVCQGKLGALGYSWPPVLNCSMLPARRCLRPRPHNACKAAYTGCQPVTLPMCLSPTSNVTTTTTTASTARPSPPTLGLSTASPSPLALGMSPNMFGQCRQSDISVEMRQFSRLHTAGCSPHLKPFLCAVYMPICALPSGEDEEEEEEEAARRPMAQFPCRELCEVVKSGCQATYERVTEGLPWPNKLQCHRYQTFQQANGACLMPEGSQD